MMSWRDGRAAEPLKILGPIRETRDTLADEIPKAYLNDFICDSVVTVSHRPEMAIKSLWYTLVRRRAGDMCTHVYNFGLFLFILNCLSPFSRVEVEPPFYIFK